MLSRPGLVVRDRQVPSFFWTVCAAALFGAVAYAIALRTNLLKGALASLLTTILMLGPVYLHRIVHLGAWD